MPGTRSRLFSGLQFRLVLGFTLALAVALALVGASIGIAADKQTQRFDRDRESAQAERVKRFLSNYYSEDGGWQIARANLQIELQRAGPVTGQRIVIYDDSGAVVADSHATVLEDHREGHDRDKRVFFKDARKFPIFLGREEVGAFTVSSFAAPPSGPDGVVDPTADQISSFLKRSLFWAGIGAAALGVVLVWLLSRRTLAPLQSLGAAARRLGRGDFSQRAEENGPSEVRDLANSFNAMAAGLEEAEQHRRNLTADIAHELRTPLSNIQGYLEAIRDGVVQPTPETIETIHGQALHLSTLVEDLRLLAQVEAGALRLELADCSMDALLPSAVGAIRPRADERGVSVSTDVAPDLPAVALDATRMAQVLANLLENAITHTPEGGAVVVSGRLARWSGRDLGVRYWPGHPAGGPASGVRPLLQGRPLSFSQHRRQRTGPDHRPQARRGSRRHSLSRKRGRAGKRVHHQHSDGNGGAIVSAAGCTRGRVANWAVSTA